MRYGFGRLAQLLHREYDILPNVNQPHHDKPPLAPVSVATFAANFSDSSILNTAMNGNFQERKKGKKKGSLGNFWRCGT